MITPRSTPFPATTLRAGVILYCTPALYGYPLDSGDDSSDENMSETAKLLHIQTASTLVVHPPPTRPLPTSTAYCPSTGKDLDATRLQSSYGSIENCITIHLSPLPSPPPIAISPLEHIESVGNDIETLRTSLAFAMHETMTPRARVGSLEQHNVVTRESLRITKGRLKMTELRSRARDIEASFWDLERHLAKCGNYKRVGHQTRDCRTLVLRANQRPLVAKQKAKDTCYECWKSRRLQEWLSRKEEPEPSEQAMERKNLWRL
ncbi:hypothetical protein Tco_0646430 [Tanacetum coccineum]